MYFDNTNYESLLKTANYSQTVNIGFKNISLMQTPYLLKYLRVMLRYFILLHAYIRNILFCVSLLSHLFLQAVNSFNYTILGILSKLCPIVIY